MELYFGSNQNYDFEYAFITSKYAGEMLTVIDYERLVQKSIRSDVYGTYTTLTYTNRAEQVLHLIKTKNYLLSSKIERSLKYLSLIQSLTYVLYILELVKFWISSNL
jgi:hypothetical protein